MSASTSSPTIHVSSGSASSAVERGLEVRRRSACRARSPRRPAAYSSAGDERARVEQRPARRLPPAVLVQAVELGAGLELGERAREVHVAEDLVRLGRLVAAAEQHGVGALADELDPVEVLDDRRHRQREHALAARARARPRSASSAAPRPRARSRARAARSASVGASAGRVVGDEAEPVPVGAQPRDRLRRARDRLARDVEDAVDVEQNARPWSGESIRVTRSVSMPARRDRAALLALERPGRPARAEDRDARRGDLRRRGLVGADRGAEAARGREGGPVAPRGRPGRAQPVAQPRARDRAARRAAARRR